MGLMARLRRFWLDVHLWIGVGLAAVLIPLGLSGAVLVYHEDMERWLEPQRFAVTEGPRLAPDVYLASAQTAFGDDFIAAQVRYPKHDDEPISVQGRAKAKPPKGQRAPTRMAFLDPATAKVLEVANPREGFFSVMHQLHGSLYIPDVGRQVVGWLGWAMTVSCLTGLWLWWPRNGAVLKALRWRRSPSTNFNLHHMAGFWILIPLLVVSVTGVYISFPKTARALTQTIAPMSAPPANPGNAGGPPLVKTELSAGQALAAAQAAYPQGDVAALARPAKPRGEGKEPPTWRVSFRVPGEGRQQSVEVRDADAQARVLPLKPADDMPRFMRRIHDGVDQHPIWRALVFLTGVAPTLLAVTGTVMWLRRRARRRAVRHAATS